MTTKAADLNKIPQRAEIEEKYTWNLSDIYKSDSDWEEAFGKAESIIKEGGQFAGKLSDPKILFECLEMRTELSRMMSSLYQYAKLNLDLDSRQSKYQEMVDRASMLSAQGGAAFSYVEPELMKFSDEELLKLSYQFEKPELYDLYVKELIRSRKHIRSEEVEELLSLSATFANGPEQTFSMLDDADLKYPTIKDEKGNEVQLTKQRFAKYMESADPRVRKDAHHAFYSVYKDHVNTTSSTLSTEINKNIFYTKARKYDSALHRALDGDNIPTAVYKALLENTESDLKGLHKWTDLRKRILKLDEIAPYDMMCPLFPDADFEVSYDEAVQYVIDACEPLGKDYVEMLKHAFSKRWVDVFETEGKGSGAYSWGNYDSHPFVLMNYNDTVDNLFTLAHELGHAMHSYLSNKNQSFTKHQYSTFVAEVASTLNEGLLMQLLLKRLESKEQKLYLLNRHIDNTFGTFFHQVLYARFELTIHDHVEKGQALSPDTLCRFWGDLTKAYYGPSIKMDEMTPLKWSRIPHFYYNFYVFQYATSYAASQGILQKLIDGEEGIIDKYLTLLSSGGNDYPIEQLKKCGIDMTKPDPVKATIDLFAQQVDQVEKLVFE